MESNDFIELINQLLIKIIKQYHLECNISQTVFRMLL